MELSIFLVRILCFILTLIGLTVTISPQASGLKLDHVIIAVQDIHEARQSFHELGFILKDGKLHANGLINSFIELSDGTEIELMSVQGKPKDSLAAVYANFLSQSEGGIYIALSDIDLTRASNQLWLAKIDHEIHPGKLWDILAFPLGSGLDHIFLIQMHRLNAERKIQVNHPNGVSGISQIWLDSSKEVRNLFRVLNVESCATDQVYEVSNASLHLIERANNHLRPRLYGIVFSSNANDPLPSKNIHGIWFKPSKESACDENP